MLFWREKKLYQTDCAVPQPHSSQNAKAEKLTRKSHGNHGRHRSWPLLYRHLWADRARSNRRRALTGSWVTPPTTGAIKIERGGDKKITINHGCGGSDCGCSCNSDGNSNGNSYGDGNGGGGDGGSGGGSGDGGGREEELAAAGAMTAMSDDDDDDDGYDDDRRQGWRRLPAPILIDCAR